MAFATGTPRNRRIRGVAGSEAGRCDITSVYLYRHGQYVLGLTFRGRFVPPVPHASEIIAPLEQPGLSGDDFAMAAIDEGFIGTEAGGPRAALPNGVRGAALESVSQVNGQNGDPEHGLDTRIHAHWEFGLESPSQEDDLSHQLAARDQESPYGATTNHSFRPIPNEYDSSPEEMTLALQTAAEQLNGNYQMAPDGLRPNDFDQEWGAEHHNEHYQAAMNRQFLGEVSNELFSTNEAGQEIIQFEEDPPTFSHETAFSFNELDFLQGVEARPNPLSASPGTDFSFLNGAPGLSQEANFPFDNLNPSESIGAVPGMLSASQQTSFDFSDSVPFSSQESGSSNLTPATSPSTPTKAPHSPNSSPDRLSCPICDSKFKRAGDRQRHEKVHSGQRDFPCTQPACNRKGGKGFYRSDKLKAHEKQVHGMHR